MTETSGPPSTLTTPSGTVSSRPLTVKLQLGAAASTLAERKTPLPDVTHATLLSKGSNSMSVAQWMPWVEIQLTPLGSRLKPLATRSVQVAPPLVERNIWSPQLFPCC